jgi:hypothetical protein
VIRSSILFLILAASFSTFAFDGKSAAREPGKSYLSYKYMASIFAANSSDATVTGKAAVDSSVPYTSESALPAVTAWDSIAAMNESFAKFRDVRWLETSDHPGFLRRSSWLYPDDGCFARAALAIMHLALWSVPTPSKIFVFGDLNVNTVNSPSGSVNWWYHVAPIVQVGNQKYVLDPALDPRQPQKLEDWLAKMAGNIYNLEVAICASGSYTPEDSCDHVTDGIEATAADDQLGYLQSEWSRLEELKRNPANELGEKPPWLSPLSGF